MMRSPLSREEVLLKKTPLPHQQEAIRRGVAHFTFPLRNGKMVMPCGAGKSLTALWIAEAIHSKITVIVIPTLHLQS
ncbi:MAG TPA: DEAD/DEAH box helicase family protein, partial [Cyclobacteriaceae bacterium]|nr:DEAD/DEAH box helicase family protein [Cyclobacteriaceae bacterium]